MATDPKGVVPHSDCSKFLVQSPHFFKVVIFPSCQGLEIPGAFMRKFGGDLQDVVSLKVPTGASWQVELVHRGNRTLLQKGWQEFAEFYSIQIYHFLVFKYEGNSQFLVLIFDPTALEIEYPVKVNSDRGDSLSQAFGQKGCSSVGTVLDVDDDEEEEILESYQATQTSKGKKARLGDTEDDVSVEIIDHLSSCKSRMRPRTRSSYRLTTENTRSESVKTVRVDTNPSEQRKGIKNKKAKQSRGEDPGCSIVKMNKESSSEPAGEYSTYIRNYKSEIEKEKYTLYQEAKAYRSSRPFFISCMQPSYFSPHYQLNIPSSFVKKFPSIKKDCKFRLTVSGNGGKWPVMLRVRGADKRVKILTGFGKFVKDNSLKVGDVCVFELGLRNREFNITVYRSTEREVVA